MLNKMEFPNKKIIINSCVTVFSFILIVKLLGLFKDILLAYLFGLGALTDAYFIAFQIPQTLMYLLGISILREMSSSVFSGYYEKNQKEDLSVLFSTIFNYASVVTILVSTAGIILMPQIVKLLPVSHYDDIDKSIVYLGRILFTFLITFGLSEYLGAVLNAFKNFFLPGFSTMCANICMIVSLLMFADTLSIASLAYGTTIGFFISCIIQFTYITTRKISYKPFVMNLQFPLMKEYIKKAVPFMIIISLSQICIFVSYVLSLRLGQGMTSALSFAGKLNEIIINLFVLPFLMVLLPEFSRNNASNDTDSLKSYIKFGAETITVIIVFCAAFLLVFNQEVVQILFMRGKFTAENAAITGNILFIYMIGLCFQAGYLYLVYIFLGIQKTLPLLLVGGVSYCLNIFLQVIFSKYFGIYGIVGGITFAAVFYFFSLMYVLKSRYIPFDFFKHSRDILKVVVWGIFLILVFAFGESIFPLNIESNTILPFIRLIIFGIIGLGIYLTGLFMLKIQIIVNLYNWVKNDFISRQ